MNNELKNQETSYDDNKMERLNLLSDKYVLATFTSRKGKGMFKKSL